MIEQGPVDQNLAVRTALRHEDAGLRGRCESPFRNELVLFCIPERSCARASLDIGNVDFEGRIVACDHSARFGLAEQPGDCLCAPEHRGNIGVQDRADQHIVGIGHSDAIARREHPGTALQGIEYELRVTDSEIDDQVGLA